MQQDRENSPIPWTDKIQKVKNKIIESGELKERLQSFPPETTESMSHIIAETTVELAECFGTIIPVFGFPERSKEPKETQAKIWVDYFHDKIGRAVVTVYHPEMFARLISSNRKIAQHVGKLWLRLVIAEEIYHLYQHYLYGEKHMYGTGRENVLLEEGFIKLGVDPFKAGMIARKRDPTEQEAHEFCVQYLKEQKPHSWEERIAKIIVSLNEKKFP